MKILKTIRGKLTFYFVLVFGLTLCVFSFVLYTVFARQNRSEFDKAMIKTANSVNAEMHSDTIQPEVSKEFKKTFVPFSSPNSQFVEIIDESGKTIYPRHQTIVVKQDLLEEALKGSPVLETVNENVESEFSDAYGMRILLYPVTFKLNKYVILVGLPLSNLERTLFRFRLLLYVAIPLTLLFSSILGWIFSKKAYDPINELIEKSNSIKANNLDTKLPVREYDDEISRLAVTLNNMMGRLQKSFLVLKQFASDASHELRTPLTILKGEIEVALSKKRSSEEYQRVLRDNLDEVERLQKIVDGLLTLSQLESGKIIEYNERINLDELLIEAISKISHLARGKNIKVVLKFNDAKVEDYEQLFVKGDMSKLLNVFINLLDNAVKYSDADSEIICSEIPDITSNKIIVSIQDHGSGISQENLENIFERFYRADLSRTRDDRNGVGLGLAIARSVVEAHGGKISAMSTLGKGTTISIELSRLV